MWGLKGVVQTTFRKLLWISHSSSSDAQQGGTQRINDFNVWMLPRAKNRHQFSVLAHVNLSS